MKFRYEEETKLEEMKLYLQSKNQRKTSDKEIINTNLKLPKLVITKFEGTHLGWLHLGTSMTQKQIKAICQLQESFAI